MRAEVIRMTFRCLFIAALGCIEVGFAPSAIGQQDALPTNQLPPVVSGNRYAPHSDAIPPTSLPEPRKLVSPSVEAVTASMSSNEQPIAPAGYVESEATPASALVTQADIDAKTKEVNEATNLDETAKKEALERLKSATEWLKTAKEAEDKTVQYQSEMQSAPNDLRDAKQTLALPRVEPLFNIATDTPLSQVEAAAAEIDERLKQAKELLAKREETLKRRSVRKTELPKLIPETEKAYEEAKKALTTARDNSSLLDAARRLDAEAKFTCLEKQRTVFPLESKRIDALAELAPLQRDMAKRDVEFLEKESAGWQKLVAETRKRDLDRQAAEARRQLHDAVPALKSLAEKNAKIAERRKELIALIESTGREVQEATASAAKIKADFDKMAEKVKKAGNSTTIGLLLRRQRDQLPDLSTCHERLRFVATETPAIHLTLLELQEYREMLDDREAAVATVIARLDDSIQKYDEASITQMVSELLVTTDELLGTLIRDHDDYIRLLGELEASQRELMERTEQSLSFIDERVLWIRSSDPISATHFSQAWSELQNLAEPTQWFAIATAISNRVAQQPLLVVLAGLAIVLMVLCRGRFQRQVDRICQSGPAELQGSILPTIEAIVASSLATAFWPGLTWLAGWQLTSSKETPELGIAIGIGLQSAAYAFWLCRLARQLCRYNGVAVLHFGWYKEVVAAARRVCSRISTFGVPCIFFTAAVTSYRDGEWSSFLGRVGLLVGMLALATFSHSLFHVRKGIFREADGVDRDGGFRQIRHGVYLLGIGIPLGLAVLAALGYDYSAQRLAMRLQSTVSVILAVSLTRAVVLRWLAVRMYRLQQAVETSGDGTASEEALPTEDPEIAKTNSELRYLLRYAMAAALFVGGYLVWSDVTPALGVFDQVEIWSSTVDVRHVVTDAEGVTKILTSQEEVPTTLKHVFAACLLLGIGMLVARNLPALVEVLVLEHMPIDRGQRYAAGMILRYLLTLAAVVSACFTIGLSWSSIQWLAAAMTVGLGFGLQEIFANLVSGLIILFERPIRVGDLVTVGGVSGRVTRMQIRATTITGFDRRELIVPNKKFITEDVMNWTLSDDVNRIVIEVGVAYGSDTDLVRELLLRAARQQRQVLADPEPIATFDRFADSSLNFTLRCFLPTLDDRLTVIHELHSAIDRAFRKANIEIAFPQQDLHVRTVDAPLRQMLRPDENQKGAA